MRSVLDEANKMPDEWDPRSKSWWLPRIHGIPKKPCESNEKDESNCFDERSLSHKGGRSFNDRHGDGSLQFVG